MSDLINRAAALAALDDISVEVEDGYGFQYAKWRQYFCDLPSAQPERKRGRWKPWDLTFGRYFYACSVCGEAADVATTMGELIYKFCPHCGADMRERRQDETC